MGGQKNQIGTDLKIKDFYLINFNQSSCVNSLQDEVDQKHMPLDRYIYRKLLSWDHEDYIFSKVTKMGSIFGHRIDYNGVGVLRGQLHIPSKN